MQVQELINRLSAFDEGANVRVNILSGRTGVMYQDCDMEEDCVSGEEEVPADEQEVLFTFEV